MHMSVLYCLQLYQSINQILLKLHAHYNTKNYVYLMVPSHDMAYMSITSGVYMYVSSASSNN